MKRIIIGVLAILLMTGCSAEYNLKIVDDKVEETLEVIETNSNYFDIQDDSGRSFKDYSKKYGETKRIYTNYYNQYSDTECENECFVYDKKYINENNKVGFSLNHSFSLEDYKNSTIASELLPGFNSTYDGQYLEISGGTSWNFINYTVGAEYNPNDNNKIYIRYAEAGREPITITIETNYKVVKTNGKRVGNTYSWKIHKGNVEGLNQLYLMVDTKEEIKEEKTSIIVYIVILILILISVIIGYNLLKKNKEYNSI